jgi:uncharacterized surface anchored protein
MRKIRDSFRRILAALCAAVLLFTLAVPENPARRTAYAAPQTVTYYQICLGYTFIGVLDGEIQEMTPSGGPAAWGAAQTATYTHMIPAGAQNVKVYEYSPAHGIVWSSPYLTWATWTDFIFSQANYEAYYYNFRAPLLAPPTWTYNDATGLLVRNFTAELRQANTLEITPLAGDPMLVRLLGINGADVIWDRMEAHSPGEDWQFYLLFQPMIVEWQIEEEQIDYTSFLEIRKYEAGTLNPLSGAVYEVADPRGSTIGTYVTGYDGKVTIPVRDIGYYSVTEVIAPLYYEPPDFPTKQVLVPDNGTGLVVFENEPYGSLTVEKRDGASGRPLLGAVIEIRHVESGTVFSEQTNSSGRAYFGNLAPGAYEIKEIIAPTGYLLRPDSQVVNVALGRTELVTLTNEAKPGLDILKFDRDTNDRLPGFTFRVHADGVLLGDYQTDAGGKIELRGLSPGLYKVTEIAAPAGYTVNPAPQEITLTGGGDLIPRLIFLNDKKPGITLEKIDAKTFAPLPGARFHLTKIDAPGQGVIGEYVTNPSGLVDLSGLEPGVYSVREITPPAGYLLEEGPERLIEIAGGQAAHFVFTDERRPSLLIKKYDPAQGLYLSGAVFTAESLEDGASYSGLVTGPDGSVLLEDLSPGLYRVKETAAPAGFLLNETEYTVRLWPGRTIELLVNNEKRPALLLMKKDADTGAPLAGASYTVKKADGAEFSVVTTDETGQAYLTDLAPGVYEVTETLAPAGYLPDAPPQLVSLRPGKTGAAQFTNHKKPGLTILKADELTGALLAGAEFSVRHKDGPLVFEGLTNEQGEINLPDLAEGWYTITELAAPRGYLKAEPKDVFLSGGQALQVKFDNRLRPALRISKVDEQTKRPLAGAKFHIRKAEDATVSEYVTGEDGTVTIYDLDEVVYTVEEISAPAGYLLAAQHRDIALAWGTVKELVFTNQEKPALVLVKRDAVTAAPLSGAAFSVRHKDGAVIWEGLTNAQGEIRLHDLEADYYTVTELRPPSGYLAEQSERDVRFEPAKTLQIEFDNTRKPVLVFLKTNALSGAGIPGATFTVAYEKPDGGLLTLGSYKTGADGRIVLPQMEPGWYVLTETLPAPGFSLPKDPVTRLHLDAGQNAYLADFAHYYTGAGEAAQSAPAPQGAPVSPTVSAVLFAELFAGHSGSEYYREGEGFNWPLNSIVIKKTHAITGELLAGAVFELYRADEQVSGVPGTMIGRYSTDHSGVVVITGVSPGYYVVKEAQAPENFLLSENAQQNGFLKADGTTVLEFTFASRPYSALLITKADARTGKPLANAKFKVTDSAGAAIGSAGGAYTTDAQGEILIPHLKPGAYIASEQTAPFGYALDAAPKTVHIDADGKTYIAAFTNEPLGSLLIRKLDSVGKTPLAGAEFLITGADGAGVGGAGGLFTTNADGLIEIANLARGGYIIRETKAPAGYQLENQAQTVQVDYGALRALTVENKPLSGIQILKTDEETGAPLLGAAFTVQRPNGERVGEDGGSYTTDAAGQAIVSGLSEGAYIVTETKAPDGYVLSGAPQTIEVQAGRLARAEFTNKPYPHLFIRKIDAATGRLLAGAQFTLAKESGEVIASVTSLESGPVSVQIAPGVYVITETMPPEGYELNDPVRTVHVTADGSVVLQGGAAGGSGYTVTFSNKALNSIEIVKRDAATKGPLADAAFTVEKANGETVGSYRTDESGKILIPGLTEGTYLISETEAPAGYILSETPKSVSVSGGKLVSVEFSNRPMAGLLIKKIDSVTRQPIGGVNIALSKINGEKIGEYTTDSGGLVFLEGLQSGWYTIAETKAADGYLIDKEPRNIEITWGKPAEITIENVPASGLLLVKTDEQTGNPLAGAVFDVRRADGQLVSGFLTDKGQAGAQANSQNETAAENGSIAGSYTTDVNGRIQINALPAGVYHVSERSAPAGYERDVQVHSVTVTPGRQASLQLTNRPKAGFRLYKTDSVTGQPIYNVEFMVFDAGGRQVGTYYTDSGGVIDFAGILPEGRYTIRETRPAEGYLRDDIPKTVTFIAGQTTEIRWENTPVQGQIQITKKSAAYNQTNGLPAGALLEGVTFAIYDKAGNLADMVKSDQNGLAVSKLLPLGRYTVKETESIPHYSLNTKESEVEIEFAGQIVRLEYLNGSVETGVSIKKRGYVQVVPNQSVRYEITEIRNGGTQNLDSFYWRDTLPTDAARLEKILTGTYSGSQNYKITYKTNLGGEQRTLADNLRTNKSYALDASAYALGLSSGEYVTEILFSFGTVPAGWGQAEPAYVYCKVLPWLAQGYQFTNKADAGGLFGAQWIMATSRWVTKVYAAAPPTLPRTGY